MFQKIPNNIRIIKLFLLFSFIICWLSVSTSFKDLLIFEGSNTLNIKNLINFFRHLSVYICFFFLILIFLVFNKKINFKKYTIFYILIGYFISQIYGLFFSNNGIENLSFVISSITTILTIILLDNFFKKDEKKYFLIVSFVILNIVFFLTFLPQFLEYLKGGSIYGGFITSDVLLNKTSPRSSGLARMALIILIFVELFKVYYSKSYSKKMLFFELAFLTFIFLFQSRTIIFLTLLGYLIIFFNKNKIILKNFLKFISFYVLIPITLFYLLSTFNSYQFAKIQYGIEAKKIIENNDIELTEKILEDIDVTFFEHLNSKELRILRIMSEGDISSGRFSDWKEILNEVSGKNIFYGFGAQGDRHLINQTASNGLIYAYSSSGLIGLIFFIIFLIIVFFETLKVFIHKFRKNTDEILHCVIILLLTLRGILETSYAVFSVDLIIFILALSFIFDNNIKIKSIKIKF